MIRHRAALALFLFTVAVFGVLAYRSEQQGKQLEVAAYETCLARVANVHRTNSLYEGLVAIERANPFKATSPSTIARRIRLFQSAMLTAPDCGQDPR